LPKIFRMQQLARCSVRLAPLKVLPDHKSEQFSQLLLGDVVSLGRQVGPWVEVNLCWNMDAGWVLCGQLEPLQGTLLPITGLSGMEATSLCGVFQTAHASSHFLIDSGWYNRYFNAISDSEIKAMPFELNNEALPISLAEQVGLCKQVFWGTPYAWGGMSFLGIDCSGLVQLLYRYRGIPLPHSASKQMHYGRVLDFIQEVKAGDLAFFANEDTHIEHVGIMLSPSSILHASARSGRVQTDMLDWQGIINGEGKRTHTLRVIKRIEE